MRKLNDEMFGLITLAGPSGHALALQILGNRDDAADVVQDAAQSVLHGASFDPERGEFHIPDGMVMSRLHRARLALAERMKRHQ